MIWHLFFVLVCFFGLCNICCFFFTGSETFLFSTKMPVVAYKYVAQSTQIRIKQKQRPTKTIRKVPSTPPPRHYRLFYIYDVSLVFLLVL